MSEPRNTEPLANGALARALRDRNPDWTDETVHAERTHVIEQSVPSSGKGLRPDILIDAPRHHPVIVETEFAPARTVEQDATARLGKRLSHAKKSIEGVLSVVLPEGLKTGDLERIAGAEFRYAAHYLDSAGNHVRWPAGKDRLTGGVDDLADAIEHLSLSERELARGTEALERLVQDAAAELAEWAGKPALSKIAADLHQAPGEQTERIAAAIFVSAFVFHAAIESQPGIPPVPSPGFTHKVNMMQLWGEILAVNYWPIFDIARNLVEDLPLLSIPRVMDLIATDVSLLAQLGATTYHDLTGRMFQRLITDRKFLATFYTLPTSACLLAELAVDRMDVDWSDKSAVESLRIADFACGTGALLSAAQRAIYRRFRRSGGDDKALHPAMMERVITGLDIMPAATHLTCSMLSSAHPSLPYGSTRIHTLPYGIDGGQTHIGALDLLDSDHSYSLFATGESMGGTEADSDSLHNVTASDGMFDLVIMNPPFTRPTNHEAGHAEIPVPSFAGFGTSHEGQDAMKRKLKNHKGRFGDGNAGLASNFMDLGHKKLREGGVMALVIPFAFAQGGGWKKARKALREHYSDVHVTSIAATGSTARAFSADTGMAECLVVAAKSAGGNASASYSNLTARPSSLLEAAIKAKDAIGCAVPGGILDGGTAGVKAASVIEAARGLATGSLRLPRQAKAVPVPMVTLGTVAERGPVDRNINDPTKNNRTGTARGPFVAPLLIPREEQPTWPMLWAHDAPRERRLIVRPDRCGEPRPGDEVPAAALWNRYASRLHSNRDFQLNSQSLAMCLTPRECLGGRAWPNVIPHNERYEIPLLLWANTTLGLISFWWKGTRQHQGRACITITKVPDLPVLDPRQLKPKQLERCAKIFNHLQNHDLQPANEAYRDTTRQTLDRQMLFGPESVLELDQSLGGSLDLLRRQWCAEPSVHGGKGTRIDG